MATNKELVQQAVAAIPLWRAFLDQKEAEQDAILAEMRNENPNESKPKKLIKSLTARFRSQPTTAITAKEPFTAPETSSVEVPLNLVAEESVVEIPISEGADTSLANDLLDKEVEVDPIWPTASPTSVDSPNKKVVAPIVPTETREPIQQVPEDSREDDDESNFKDIF